MSFVCVCERERVEALDTGCFLLCVVRGVLMGVGARERVFECTSRCLSALDVIKRFNFFEATCPKHHVSATTPLNCWSVPLYIRRILSTPQRTVPFSASVRLLYCACLFA